MYPINSPARMPAEFEQDRGFRKSLAIPRYKCFTWNFCFLNTAETDTPQTQSPSGTVTLGDTPLLNKDNRRAHAYTTQAFKSAPSQAPKTRRQCSGKGTHHRGIISKTGGHTFSEQTNTAGTRTQREHSGDTPLSSKTLRTTAPNLPRDPPTSDQTGHEHSGDTPLSPKTLRTTAPNLPRDPPTSDQTGQGTSVTDPRR